MLAAVGPGIVVTGSVIGSGEMINTPTQAAKFGFVLLWAVLVSCVIKYFLQVEIARYCLVENRSTFQALNAIPGPKFRGTIWIAWVYMVGYVLVMLVVVGIIGSLGGLMNTLWPLAESPERSGQIWGGLCCLLGLVLLWQGLYPRLETLVTLLVAGFSLSVGVGVFLIQGTEYRISGEELLSGLTFSLGPDRQAAGFAVISLMGALGVAANEMFMYPYWILEKGYREHLGDPADPQWPARARHWINTIRLDAGLALLVTTIVTAAFYLLGAAVLFRRGEVPQGLAVVEQISSVYTKSYGEWSSLIFFVGAFCTLFSTLVVVVAASGRMWADFISSIGLLNRDDPRAIRRCHQVVQVVWMAGLYTAFLTLNIGPVTSIIVGHFILGGFLTPLLMFCIVWMAFHTDKRVRMGRATAVALIASVAVIVACVAIGGWHALAALRA